MSIKNLTQAINENIEWLQTTEGDEVECISIENLQVVLSTFLGRNIILGADEESEKEETSRFTQLEMF